MRRTEGDLRQAIDNYQRAVTLDPSYAEAYAGLAISYAVATSYIRDTAKEFVPLADAAAHRAVELAPNLGEAHLALAVARAFSQDWVTTESEFKKAMNLNPNDANVHYFYAYGLLVPQKRFEEALREYRRALDLDPLSPIVNTNYAVTLMIARQYDAAAAQFKVAQALDPSFKPMNLRLAQFHAFQGDFEDAKVEFGKSGLVGDITWQPGREGFYRSLLSSESRTASQPEEAFAAAALGDEQRAIQALERIANEDPADVAIFVRRPEFDALHSEPEFLKLLGRLKLQP
jgi:Tfp pilus assembly protein PilF